MEEFEKLVTFGERLGYKGETLQTFVRNEVAWLEEKRQQELDRDERAEQRALQREKEHEDFEREKKAREESAKIMRGTNRRRS